MLGCSIGTSVSSANIIVEPWELLQALVNRLDILSSNNRIACKLIKEGPNLSTHKSISNIEKGQDIALQRAITDDITFIWGPPGTGKTYTMAQIAISFLTKGKRILIVSHSNVSVDGAARQIKEQLVNNGENKYLKSGKIIRYGFIRNHE